jgi:glycosyltransferase involved in cell wall biosynthesis
MRPSAPRLAWFSPLPPARTGVASVSADLLAALRSSYDIDPFVDAGLRQGSGGQASTTPPPVGASSAHDFVWRHLQRPYDLVVYQLGNSAEHEYIWPYLFRYPGLTVLHDAHVHHARAAALLRHRRTDDYRAEFAANQPGVNADLAEVGVAGFDSHLYYLWPMIRLVLTRSRLTLVHTPAIARSIRDAMPDVRVEAVRLGHGEPVSADEATRARHEIRQRHGIAPDAILFGCFGGLAPEKRIPQVLRAFAALHGYEPGVRLLLTGAPARHYDLDADIRATCPPGTVIATGYVRNDEELTAHIAASDVALNLRWPTAREISGPWLRSLAAGVPTVITQLAHLTGVAWLDPRTWRSSGVPGSGDAVCVGIDILDEDHSLLVAMRRLARDSALRTALAQAGRRHWEAHHTPEVMATDYRRAIELARTLAEPSVELPAHLLDDGRSVLNALLTPFGTPDPLR